jgi:hypothetical protein
MPGRRLNALLTLTALATSAFFAPSARAQGTTAPTDYAVTFDQPQFWGNRMWQSWTLEDRHGNVVCALPCTTRLGPSSGYVLEGVGFGQSANDLSDTAVRLQVPDLIVERPGSALVAHARPQKGNPDGALVLGLVGGAVTLAGLTLIALGANAGDPGDGIVEVIAGVALDIGGIPTTIAGLVWGALSERPEVTLLPAARSIEPLTASPPALQVSFSPTGIVGRF